MEYISSYRKWQYTVVLLLSSCGIAWAQPGTLDLSFNASDSGYQLSAVSGIPSIMKVFPDGKLLLTGSNGTDILVRRERNGYRDKNFFHDWWYTVRDFYATINAFHVQPDGKIIIAESVYNRSSNGFVGGAVSRYLPNGIRDTSFGIINADFNGNVLSLCLQADNKILVGGNFTTHKGIPAIGMLRLHLNGTRDTSFHPSFGGKVNTISILSSGSIIAAGDFSSVSSQARNRICKLFANGSVDTTFVTGVGANAAIQSSIITSSGKILLTGNFTTYNNQMHKRMVQIDTLGVIDAGFQTGSGFDTTIHAVHIQSDNKILVAGQFNSYNGIARSKLVRLMANGSLDGTFNASNTIDSIVYAVGTDSLNNVYISGNIHKFNNQLIDPILKLSALGVRDFDYNKQTGFNAAISCLAKQADGKLLAGGVFTRYFGRQVGKFLRMLPDGQMDTTFMIGNGVEGTNSVVETIVLQTDNKILVGGRFTVFNGRACNNIIRLHANGAVDTTFNTSISVADKVTSISLQPDGKIIIGGVALSNGTCKRLMPNGTIDVSFTLGSTLSQFRTTKTLLTSDGKVFVYGGSFLRRYFSNGSVDTTFTMFTFNNQPITSIILRSNGKLLVAVGELGNNTVNTNRLVSLNNSGLIDSLNNFVFSNTGEVYVIKEQFDNKLVLVGSFLKFRGINCTGIVRLKQNLEVDSIFTHQPTSNLPIIKDMILLESGELIIAGDFIEYHQIGRNNICKIKGDNITLAQRTEVALCAGKSFTLNYSSITMNSGNQFSVQLSNSSGSFTNPSIVGSVNATGSGSIFCSIPSNTIESSNYRYKLISTNPVFTSEASLPFNISSLKTFFKDNDEDGFGNPSIDSINCFQPLGFVSNNLDCNDNDSSVFINKICSDADSRTFDDRIDTTCACKGKLITFAKAEYFLNNDPGVGKGISITLPNDTSIDLLNTISTESVPLGFHILGLRFLDNRNIWSHTEFRIFFITAPIIRDSSTQQIVQPKLVQVEYFFDSIGNAGTGTTIAVSPDSIINGQFTIPQTLSRGFHTLYVSIKDNRNVRSIHEGRTFFVTTNIIDSTKKVARAIFFIDSIQANGLGTNIPLTPDTNINISRGISLPFISKGFHQLYIQLMDANGIWSLPESRTFYVTQPDTLNNSKIVKAEFSIDSIVAQGTGSVLSLPLDTVININRIISTAGVSKGFHQLYMRLMNEQGIWSHTSNGIFVVKESLPILPKLVSGEIFFNKDSGATRGIPFTFTPDTSINKDILIPIPAGLALGTKRVYARLKDERGIWSLFEKANTNISITTFNATIAAVSDTIVCANDTVSLQGAVDGLPIQWPNNGTMILIDSVLKAFGYNISWQRNGVTISGAQKAGLKTNLSGAYRFIVDSTDISRIITATVNPKPALPIITGRSVVHKDTIEPYKVTPTIGSTFQWSILGGAQVSGGNTDSIRVDWLDTVSSGMVRVRETNIFGCKSDTAFLVVGSILPVQLIHFGGKQFAEKVLLNWTTVFEQHTNYFEIQRSADNELFEAIGSVKANGYSMSPLHYTYSDKSISALDKWYYRLRMVDNDGSYTYSKSLLFTQKQQTAQGDVLVYPNPSLDGAVYIYNPSNEMLELKINDTHGKLLHEQIIETQAIVRVLLNQYADGLYFFSLQSSSKVNNVKVFLGKQ
jgi:uncharacterized delta-60 repeat protein